MRSRRTARLGHYGLERLGLKGLELRHKLQKRLLVELVVIIEGCMRLQHQRFGLQPLVLGTVVAE
jgi:hypothetical protein